MFGILRYLLALLVVQTHLWKITPWAGFYAVFTFYMLSGYLMTLVLNERYGKGPGGFLKYLLNRALRIYPPYLAVLAMAIGVVYYFPEIALSVHKSFSIPVTTTAWLKNIFVVGAYHPVVSTLVIPAWSLHVELIFYAAMGLLLSRRWWIAGGWFLGSLAYTVFLVIQYPSENQFWFYRYFPPEAASLPFSAGACLYFARGLFKERLVLILLAAALFAANIVFAGFLWEGRDLYIQGFYLSIFLSVVLIALLARLDPSRIPGFLRRIDKFLGDISYPIFLCHVPCAALVIVLYFHGMRPWNNELFWASVPFIHVAAILLHFAVEKPFNGLREALKSRKTEIENLYKLDTIY